MLDFNYKLDGGSLTSIKLDGKEMMFELDKEIWNGQDNIIFPFVARLKNKEYMIDNTIYNMEIHGVAKYQSYEVLEESENKSVILLKSNDKTLAQYPFEFELKITYEKEGNTLSVSYEVTNLSNRIMPFGIGGHPGLKVIYENNDTKGNYITFNKVYNFDYYALEETGCLITKKENLGDIKSLEVDKSFFKKYKTLILDAKDINECILERKDGIKVKFSFNSKYLAIWSNPNAGDYVCVEPWDGLPDFLEPKLDMYEKEGINKLKPNDKYKFSYKMEFIK